MKNAILLLWTFWRCRLNMCTDEDCMTSSDKLFHLLLTLTEKKYFLISSWQQGLLIFSECPLVHLSVSSWKKQSNGSNVCPLHNLKTSIRSARFLRSYNVHKLKRSNRLVQSKSLKSLNNRVKRCCTFSRHSLSFTHLGDQAEQQYSRCGRTKDL